MTMLERLYVSLIIVIFCFLNTRSSKFSELKTMSFSYEQACS